MNEQTGKGAETVTICEEIRAHLEGRKLAVLATESGGQPHASLMAFTPVDGIKRLVLATYRKTRKYESLIKGSRAALLIGSGIEPFEQQCAGLIVTAHGAVSDAPAHLYQSMLQSHIQRHPDFAAFFSSPECALIVLDVSTYQLVTSTDDVRWCSVDGIL